MSHITTLRVWLYPLLALALALAAGCDNSAGHLDAGQVQDRPAQVRFDSGWGDGTVSDVHGRDAAGQDRGAVDARGQDAAGRDSGAVDTRGQDTAGRDSGANDAGAHDSAAQPGACVDTCALPLEGQGGCGLWDDATQAFAGSVETGDGHLHNRARLYASWLRQRLMPEGGVMRAQFTDATLRDVAAYAGTRDSPIWTGIYLGAEALRYQVTRAPDALAQMRSTAQTLHRWWSISGDPGYLARYAVPASAAPEVLAIFDPSDPEFHFDVPFEGGTWHWRGNVSRDQYQGVFFGYGLAYDASDDATLRESLRADAVTAVEQLMQREVRTFNISLNGGIAFPKELEVENVIYTDDETEDGLPAIDITVSPFNAADKGFIQFWPDPMLYLHAVPGLGWVPTFYLRSQAIQLGGMFAVALHLTEGAPAYAARRAAILAYYEAHFEEWLDMASGWRNSNNCGDSYHGLNIAFLPAFCWARFEPDPARRARVRQQVLGDAMWPEVFDHKNVFFAFIYASQPPAGADVSQVVADHVAQLRLFPPAPNTAVPRDNRAEYEEDPDCEDQSLIAIDVDDRVPSTFMWERQPWKLYDPGTPNFLYSGLDYLITYWMARAYGFLADDAPGTCTRTR